MISQWYRSCYRPNEEHEIDDSFIKIILQEFSSSIAKRHEECASHLKTDVWRYSIHLLIINKIKLITNQIWQPNVVPNVTTIGSK